MRSAEALRAHLPTAALAALREAGGCGLDCVVVVLDAVAGSTPREAGTAMLVRADGAWGTIGGGHLELKSIELARAMLDTAVTGPARHRFPLGPALGQCCGGVAHVSLVPCPRGVVPARLHLYGPEPLFNLFLYGAGHVGQALVDVLAGVECAITWIDSREQQFPARVPPNTRVEFSEDPAHDAAQAPTGGFHLIMTHSHALDFAIVHRLMVRDDAAWIGMIGSRTKRVTFERRLRERGIESTRVARLACPIGLPGITGKSPGVVAVAVAAQLLGLAGHAVTPLSGTAAFT